MFVKLYRDSSFVRMLLNEAWCAAIYEMKTVHFVAPRMGRHM